MKVRFEVIRRSTRLALAAVLALRPAPALAQRAEAAVAAPSTAALTAREFARLVGDLSEPGGHFDTDNLISNERGYLHVMGALDRLGVRGGAYVGVGPDQNFSYIARIRPTIAFVIDIRRDNLLQQLLFKALFARARNRVEYLALLTGRPVPADVEAWRDRSLEAIVAYLDSTGATPASEAAARELARVGAVVGKEGRTRQRVHFAGTSGAWGEMEVSINTLIDDLLWPTTAVPRAIAAVAQGDLQRTVPLEVEGRPLEGEFLRSATIVNTMIKQLGVFTSEVTRVAREVGTDGKLGGQAEVKGVGGTWKDLTDNVKIGRAHV